jgi:hypothetical protein
MRVLSLNELMRLSHLELCNLLAQMTNILRIYPEGSSEHQAAVTNLRNISRILANRELTR